MHLVTKYLEKGTPPRPGTLLKEATSITIHWIGPYPGQSVYDPWTYWQKGLDGKGLQVSAHFVIKDDTVLYAIPITEVAYHTGTLKGNATSIGIEIVPLTKEGLFSDKSIETAMELINTYIPTTLELKRHFDWSGKNCPLYYTPLSVGGDDRWQILKEQLNGTKRICGKSELS